MRRADLRKDHAVLHRMQLLLPLCLLALFPSARADSTDEQTDGLEERLAPCAACHGEGGRSASEVYFPSLAGKPAGYLYAQLENYRAGRRRHTIMENLLAHLSEPYLKEIAAYYASQQPKWTPPRQARSDDELARGRELVEHGDADLGVPSCRACHGERLTGVAPYIPGLVGLRPEYLSAQLAAWRSGARRSAEPDCMAEIARRIDRDDLYAVTAWIASRPYPDDPRPAETQPRELPLECGIVR
ncbi:MAG TPA: c-type cytochrome [Gammaproteobacteria bacterium]